ncbi:hypothetical protein EIP86_001716 [Pleurotus ostreatoroseus]|nr:hypothetical protein EIP86_001716 [Pleurotus ostreatoroseus]
MSSRIVPPQRGYPFYVTAKRYRFNGCEPQHPEALTLLLLHSTSFHKEIYEPTFDELALCLIRSAAVGAPKIKEAWVVECPNHGESAILNQELLKQPMYEDYFSCETYAEAAYHFLNATDANGRPYINCPESKMIGIGHSLGGVSMMFLSAKVKFASLIIIDPFIFAGKPEDLRKLRERLVRCAHERQDVWPTREKARESLLKKQWDSRILDLYVTMYRDPDGATKPIPDLRRACSRIPVHIAFGKKSDIM